MLDIFTPVLPASRLCEHFRRIAADATEGDRALLSHWLRGFVDRDGKFVQELQATFSSAFWELYLHAALNELGFTVDYQHSRPDFVVTAPIEFCIEAVTAQPAGKSLLDPGSTDDISAAMVDLNALNREAIIRLANAFSSKYRKLRESYARLEHVAGRPFILAMAAYNSPAFFALATRPIEALLYNYYVDEEAFISGRNGTLEGEVLESVRKHNDSTVELGVFSSDKFSDVSAVIYNPVATWGKVRTMSAPDAEERVAVHSLRYNPRSNMPHRYVEPKGEANETLLDGLFVFHNRYAATPLSPDIFRNVSVAQVYFDQEMGEYVHERREGHLLFRNVLTIRSV